MVVQAVAQVAKYKQRERELLIKVLLAEKVTLMGGKAVAVVVLEVLVLMLRCLVVQVVAQ